MLAAIWEVAVAVSVGENNWLKLIEPLVAVLQSGTLDVVLTVPPVQKTRDSGMVPLRLIWVAVLAATVPVSVAPPVVSVLAKVDILTKKVQLLLCGVVPPKQLLLSGLVTVESSYEELVATPLATVRVR